MKDIKILTITGVSGSGKTTLVQNLLQIPDRFRLLVSSTTRPARPSDLIGEYRHIPIFEFQELHAQDAFWHATEFSGNWYGTEKREMEAALADSRISLAIIVPNMVQKVCSYAPERSQALFLFGPTAEEQYTRMRLRGDSDEAARKRVESCREWEVRARQESHYHFIGQGTPEEIVNQTLSFLDH